MPPRTLAVVLTVSVLARPGTPSISRWPPASRQTSTRSSIASCPAMIAPDLEQRALEALVERGRCPASRCRRPRRSVRRARARCAPRWLPSSRCRLDSRAPPAATTRRACGGRGARRPPARSDPRASSTAYESESDAKNGRQRGRGVARGQSPDSSAARQSDERAGDAPGERGLASIAGRRHVDTVAAQPSGMRAGHRRPVHDPEVRPCATSTASARLNRRTSRRERPAARCSATRRSARRRRRPSRADAGPEARQPRGRRSSPG